MESVGGKGQQAPPASRAARGNGPGRRRTLERAAGLGQPVQERLQVGDPAHRNGGIAVDRDLVQPARAKKILGKGRRKAQQPLELLRPRPASASVRSQIAYASELSAANWRTSSFPVRALAFQ